MKRKLKLINAQGICAWYDAFSQEKNKALPLRVQWNLLSNIKELRKDVGKFTDLRNSFIDNLNKEYFGDDKSYIYQNEKGEDVRRIRDEYYDEYKTKVDEANKVIFDASLEENEYEFRVIDVEKLIDEIPTDSGIQLEDIEIMSIFGGED